MSADVRGKVIPLLVRRGGCGIRKISAKPTLMPQTGWSLTNYVVTDHPVRSFKGRFATSSRMSRPPLLMEEGNTLKRESCNSFRTFFMHLLRKETDRHLSLTRGICGQLTALLRVQF